MTIALIVTAIVVYVLARATRDRRTRVQQVLEQAQFEKRMRARHDRFRGTG